MLPLPHALGRRGPDERQVDEAADEHGGDGDQRAAVRVGEQARRVVAQRLVADRAGARGEGQAQDERQRRLHGEVDGEGLGLQLREMRARQYPEGDHPADEGLEERAAQEGAIALVWAQALAGRLIVVVWGGLRGKVGTNAIFGVGK